MLKLSTKKIVFISLGAIALITVLIMFLSSFKDVSMGCEAFIYRPYGGGIDSTVYYGEGTFMIAPWNQMVQYNTRNQTNNYVCEVMDKNSTGITILVSVNFSATPYKSANLHKKHGPEYSTSFVDTKSRGAVKDVVGRYSYEEIVSTKRELLEQEIEHILQLDFGSNFITLGFVEVSDVDLPKDISDAITAKETQKQKNLKSELYKIEERNIADARIQKARGDSSLVVSAEYKALAIKKETNVLKANPEYIQYIMWKGYSEGQGSPYGTGNVFGSGTSVIKNLK